MTFLPPQDEWDAMILAPECRGLKNAEVTAKLGSQIAGGPQTVGRVRKKAGLDGRGYPIHSAHRFDIDAAATPELVETDREFDRIDRLMRSGPGVATTARVQSGSRVRTRAIASRPFTDVSVVYFIQADTPEQLIKIGTTTNLPARLSDLSVGSPVTLSLIGHMPGGRATEQRLHTIFAADRVRGEWFRPTDDLLALANGRAFIAANGHLKHRPQVTES